MWTFPPYLQPIKPDFTSRFLCCLFSLLSEDSQNAEKGCESEDKKEGKCCRVNIPSQTLINKYASA